MFALEDKTVDGNFRSADSPMEQDIRWGLRDENANRKLTLYEIQDADLNTLGYALLGSTDGRIDQIANIELYPQHQNKGVGREIVGALLHESPEIDLHWVKNEAANDAWVAMGAKPTEIGYDGSISRSEFDESLKRKETRGSAATERSGSEQTPDGEKPIPSGSGSNFGEVEQGRQDANSGTPERGAKGKGSNAANIRDKLKSLFVSPNKFDERVKIYQHESDLPAEHQDALTNAKGKVQAFVDDNGNVHMIADNIPQGQHLSVFLHDVGVHLGVELMLGPERLNRLINQVDKWAQQSGTLESEIAKAAIARAANFSSHDTRAEKLAYFVEEAVNRGVNPKAIAAQSSPMGRFFRAIMDAFGAALRKLGVTRIDTLTAQYVVDLAHGMAQLALTNLTVSQNKA